MNILERAAIETLAKSLYDDYNRSCGYTISTWKGLKSGTRDVWRERAENFLNESYYNDR